MEMTPYRTPCSGSGYGALSLLLTATPPGRNVLCQTSVDQPVHYEDNSRRSEDGTMVILHRRRFPRPLLHVATRLFSLTRVAEAARTRGINVRGAGQPAGVILRCKKRYERQDV